MNQILAGFLKVGLKIAEAQVPAIAIVEQSITALTKPGADKQAEAIAMVKAAPAIAELLANNPDLVNDALFNEAVVELNDGYVKLMNSLKKHNVAVTSDSPAV